MLAKPDLPPHNIKKIHHACPHSARKPLESRSMGIRQQMVQVSWGP